MAEFSYTTGWTDIANDALRALTEKKIANLNDGTPNANYCRQFLGKAIQTVLSEEDWACATARATLNRLTATPDFGFSYYYQLPEDLVRVLDDGVDTGGGEFAIEGDRLATDAEAVYLRYIANPDPAKLIPAVRAAIASQLAMLLAIPLNSSTETERKVMTQYGLDMVTARKANGKSKKPAGDGQGDTWYDEAR